MKIAFSSQRVINKELHCYLLKADKKQFVHEIQNFTAHGMLHIGNCFKINNKEMGVIKA